MAHSPSTADAATDGNHRRPAPATVRSEDVFLRNYDPYWGYDLSLVVSEPDGEPVLRRDFFFRPGQTEFLRGVLDPGQYDVTVTLDDRREKSVRCRVGPDADETIHVEIGNGLVSVTEGLFG